MMSGERRIGFFMIITLYRINTYKINKEYTYGKTF